VGVPISRISRLPIWEFQEKWDLGPTHVPSHKEYYKGEGGGFPQVWTMVSFVSPCMFVICLCTKNALIMH
jgi:hypothetical protein